MISDVWNMPGQKNNLGHKAKTIPNDLKRSSNAIGSKKVSLRPNDKPSLIEIQGNSNREEYYQKFWL